MGFLAILFKYALADYAEQFLFGAYVVSLKKREQVSKLIIALLAVDAVGGALFGLLFPEMRAVRPYIRLVSVLLRTVVFLMIFDTPVIKGVFQYLFVDIYSKTLHIPIGIIYAVVTRCDSRFIIDSIVDRVICPVITIIGLLAVKYFKEKYKDKRFVDLSKAGSMAYVVAIISGICAVMEKHAVVFVDAKHPMFNKPMWDISGVLISIVFITMGYMVLVANSLWKYYRNESTIRNERINLLKTYYDSIYENQEKLRKVKHDINDHLIVIRSYIEEEKYDVAIEYIDVLVEKVSNTLKAIDIGNNVASALIENKKMLAMSKGVELIIEGDLKGLKVPVEDTDMCVILANLLNNAVEGVLETGKEEKKVHVKIARIKQFQIIKIENECVLSELSKDSLISKKGAGHGYGLKNVRETAEKYGGVLDYYVKDGVFTATVTFDDQYAC